MFSRIRTGYTRRTRRAWAIGALLGAFIFAATCTQEGTDNPFASAEDAFLRFGGLQADREHVLIGGERAVVQAIVLDALNERARFGVVAQTTQPIERVRQLVARLRHRFPRAEVRFIDTVCQPTKLRQHAAADLAQRCDVVVVIGGAESNNTRELAATCRHHCARVHHVQTASDLQPDWFGPDDRAGLTAGTSTPDTIIDEVEEWMGRVAKALAARAPVSAA